MNRILTTLFIILSSVNLTACYNEHTVKHKDAVTDIFRRDYVISCLHGDGHSKDSISTTSPSPESIKACEELAYRMYPK